jgi:UDP-N-acetylmuramoyl-L-alanyl-D-glutamate--2,6-diaminopimelate ligase
MLPKILKNFNVFVDGRGYAGKIDEITLPKLTIKTEEYRAGGMDIPVSIDMGMEKLEADTPYSIFIDYAHTPDALESVLKSIRGFCAGGRIISVFGCGGDRDKTKRPEMGRIAAENSDFCVITSDNSRSEEPLEIIKDIIVGIGLKSAYEIEIDRRKAIELAMNMAEPRDIILLAGKGHEEYIDEKGEIKHFSEREAVFDILKREKLYI